LNGPKNKKTSPVRGLVDELKRHKKRAGFSPALRYGIVMVLTLNISDQKQLLLFRFENLVLIYFHVGWIHTSVIPAFHCNRSKRILLPGSQAPKKLDNPVFTTETKNIRIGPNVKPGPLPATIFQSCYRAVYLANNVIAIFGCRYRTGHIQTLP
jgi:hypothetical protein